MPLLAPFPLAVVGAALFWARPLRGSAAPEEPPLLGAEPEPLGAPALMSLLQQGFSHWGARQAAHAGTAVERGSTDSSTCGLDEEVAVPDCERVDMGSCGNACCALDLELGLSPDAAYEAVAGFLKSGGDSGAYTLVPGEMPHNEHPPDNLTSLDLEGGWKFIFQGKHTTSGRGYVDTLNFNIRTAGDDTTILRAFSISDLHGALGDAGQNYKTLAYLFRAIGVDPGSATLLYGCGVVSGEAGLLQGGGPSTEGLLQASGLASTLAPASTCGMSGGVADCDRPDTGSCGNACCALEVTWNKAPRASYEAVAGFLASGGDSGSYALVPGKMPHDEHPADDLTSLGIDGGWEFIFQGVHTTSARRYVDTLNFNIRSGDDDGSSVLRAFSISNLHGSLGDAGQNFKSLAWLLDALQISRAGVRVLTGCAAS